MPKRKEEIPDSEIDGVLEFEYVKSKDYKIYHATGAWGGLSPRSEIYIDFFIEKAEPPEKSKLYVKDKEAIKEEKIPKEDKLIRELQACFILRPDIAYAIGEWLIKKAEEAGIVEKKNANNEK